ncbi:MAG: 3-deoxy-D-manno-octulosonic acid transferase [Bacteroidetes bacterium]|nr:3-deoxy-D-manno-octulosonic acid transferase [Bacteroidota bacterium]MBS1629217.1 3-deoxy-D-manno-octulosonic acid transferase [Bacteroidota bacterium]
MLLLYRLFLWLYQAAIAISSLWNKKAGAWMRGRKGQWQRLAKQVPVSKAHQVRYWMHCASLGEFEQGRPLIEALKARDPGCVVLLSFFSPSGYEPRKDYPFADLVCYLPMDGPHAAARFLDFLQPTQALFVKYEFWYFYLNELSLRKIPSVLVSGIFRESQPFFAWWGLFFRKMLRLFSLLSLQDAHSLSLLQARGLAGKAVITGDTRYDRVATIASEARPIPIIESFRGDDKLIIAGSTWPEDERLLCSYLPHMPQGWKLVLAPHEIDTVHLSAIQEAFGKECIFYSAYKPGGQERVLVIDNIGMLSSLYRYGALACIGGGFNRGGIHNVLEPAVFGLPVVMGPNYQKFREAVELVRLGLAFAVADESSLYERLQLLTSDDALRERLAEAMSRQVVSQTGATAKILSLLPVAH